MDSNPGEQTNKPMIAKKPFYKKRAWKITFLVGGIILLLLISYISYVIAQGGQFFDQFNLRSLGKTIFSNEQLEGNKEDRINIVFSGIGGSNHPGGQLTDSLMVVSLKPSTKSMAMVSIPRDLQVVVPKTKSTAKINEVYAYGEKNKKGGGAQSLKETLSEITGQPMHYYLTVDFAGFEKFVNEIGGIDVNVEQAISDPLYPDKNMQGYEPFTIKAGPHHLDGATALKYARSRYSSSDFDRSARQQKIIVAVSEKITKIGFFANPKRVADTATIFGDHFKTDLSPAELKTLANFAKEIDRSKIYSQVLSNADKGPLVADSSTGTYLLKPRDGNFNSIKNIFKQVFEPVTPKEDTEVSIEILNGSAVAGRGGQLAEILRGYGYKIENIASAPTKFEKTTIYDYSSSTNTETIDFLKKHMNINVIEKKTKDKQASDIAIVIGNDYTGFN